MSVIKHSMEGNFISDSFYHMIIAKISILHGVTVYFEKIPCESCSEKSWFTK